MSYDLNMHGSPEKWGLRAFAEIDVAGSYEFDMCCVWEDERTGDLFYAFDSGCSCPTPFEDVTCRDDTTALTNATWAEFAAAVHGMRDYADDQYGGEKGELLAKCAGRLTELERKDRLTPGWRNALLDSGALAAEVAELKQKLAQAEADRDAAQHDLQTLRSGVRQQEELWELLRNTHRELDLWFNAAIADPAEAKSTVVFQVRPGDREVPR